MGRGNGNNSDTPAPRDEPLFTEADMIHRYTRAQAIADGVLVEVSSLTPDEPEFVRSAGFNVSVALTASLAALVVPNQREEDYGQDLKGRLWDLLNMARIYRPRPMPDEGGDWKFPCIFVVIGRSEYGRQQHKEFELKANIGGGDNGEPVVTFMFPDED
jgi:hypothetical protein